MRPWATTLTFNFHDQILKNHIPGIGGKIDMDKRDVNSHVNRKSELLCEFEFLAHPWPSPLILKVKFWKGSLIKRERKGCESRLLNPLYDLELWPWPWIFKLNWHGLKVMWVDRKLDRPTLWLSTLTPPVTLTLDVHGQIFKKAVSQEWDGKLTWNERDVSQ